MSNNTNPVFSNIWLVWLLAFVIITGCQKEYTPETNPDDEDIIIEGYIDAGVDAIPPYVLVTRSVPFFSEISADKLEEVFVHDAEVYIGDSNGETLVNEVCLDQVPPNLRDQVANILGIANADSVPINICAYISLNIQAQIGETYTLRVIVDGSIFDDLLINGETFEFPLARGQLRTADFDPVTFGFFWRGDTINVRWMNIDEQQYNFWNTLEFNTGTQGPFTSFTRIKSNIEGGALGVWGGSYSTYHQLIVPE